ncbi:MAG: hypothetical protein GYA21_20150 [Myxococcales bacterium]|nr:hypothetical protein [Myxococcales bacterium]
MSERSSTTRACPVCGEVVPAAPYCPRCRTRIPSRDSKLLKSAWGLAGGAVLVIVLLLIWRHEVGPRAIPGAIGSGDKSAADGPLRPGDALLLPVPEERCIPWNVSAKVPAPRGEPFLFLGSRVLDPFGVTLAGFFDECGPSVRSLWVEALAPGELQKTVAELRPAAIVALGPEALARVRAEAPDVPRLYTHVRGADRLVTSPNELGVTLRVPLSMLARHLDRLTPPGREVAVWHEAGAFAPCGEELGRAFSALGRRVMPLPMAAPADLDAALARAKTAGAWAVLPGREVLDDRAFARLQVEAERARIPLLVPDEEHVRRGAFAGAGPDSHRIGEQLCHLAGAMLKGELPAGANLFCPEYTFGALHITVAEKLGLVLDPQALIGAKFYKWY